MRILSVAILLMAFAVQSTAATAEEKVATTRQFGSGDTVRIDPSQAYIIFRLMQKSPIRFLRLPSDGDRSAYEKERSEAFAKEKLQHPDAQENSFKYPSLEMKSFEGSEFNPVFDRQDNQLVYLLAVEPGTYVLYGAIWSDADGVSDADTCFCMGSVKFEAAAGKVTDIGRIRLADDWDGRPPPANPAGRTQFALIPASSPLHVKGRLSGLPVEAADLHAAGKMPNYLGVLIDRLAPVAGVLDYDQDKVVDVRAPATSN